MLIGCCVVQLIYSSPSLLLLHILSTVFRPACLRNSSYDTLYRLDIKALRGGKKILFSTTPVKHFSETQGTTYELC